MDSKSLEVSSCPEPKKIFYNPGKFHRRKIHRRKRGKGGTPEKMTLNNCNHYKTSKIPTPGSALGFDVEKVKCRKTNQMFGCWVALSQTLHKHPYLVYHAVIHYPEKEFDRLRRFSGITYKMMLNGVSKETVLSDLSYFLSNYKIVGVDILSDLRSLGLEEFASSAVDLQTTDGFFKGKRNQRLSLRDLTKSLCGKEIQKDGQSHNPSIDSRLTVTLYQLRVEGRVHSETDSDNEHSFEYVRTHKTSFKKAPPN